jgi:hypothetical protein
LWAGRDDRVVAAVMPGDPLGFCAPCLPSGALEQAVTLVEGTGMCRRHALAALSAVTGSSPLVRAALGVR